MNFIACGFLFSVNSDDFTVSICGCRTTSEQFAIPNKVKYLDKEYLVTEIANHAFSNCHSLKFIVISSAELEISYMSFISSYFFHLESIFFRTINLNSRDYLYMMKTKLYIPKGSLKKYIAAGFDKSRLKEMSVKEMNIQIAKMRK